MDRRGHVLENPVTGEHVVILTDPETQAEGALVAHLTVHPGGRVAIAHLHPTLRERFYVLAGEVGFLLGEEERVLRAADAAEVPPGTVHDWWQVGDSEAEVIARRRSSSPTRGRSSCSTTRAVCAGDRYL
jgi:mannose-6-phosphate isomerase-like protein (cupin superfamily)